MKHWNISLPRTPALALARQMLEGCLRTYDVPMEDAEDALLRCGYSRGVQVDGPGQFSRRGGPAAGGLPHAHLHGGTVAVS